MSSSLPIYKNSKSPVEKRVEDLLHRMTLEEKVEMLGGTGFESKPNKRLGIPALNMTDGPVCVRWGKATAFPASIAMAASWNPELVKRIGQALGRETKAKGRNVLLGPCINIQRVPHAGRNFEGFGEDPYLTSKITVSYVKGIQSEKVVATTKHFACNNQENDRFSVDTIVDERTLREIYLPAFKAAVQEAGSWAIMCAYNRLNGYHCSSHVALLTDILKNEWGFKGLVMSDWGAVHSTIPTLFSGLDLEMPKDLYLTQEKVLEAVKRGLVKESKINDKVRRMLRTMFAMGFFDQVKPDLGALDTPEHRKLALEVSQESIVLLKNEKNILPLDVEKIKSIAVIGPNAEILRIGGGGSARVGPFYSVSPLEALKKKFGKKIEIKHSLGVFIEDEMIPIGTEYFRTSQDGKEETGLFGEYFDNRLLKGEPVIRRIDSHLDFHWDTWIPENLQKDNFSVRWTGKLIPPRTAKYVFNMTSDDGARVYLNGKIILDNWETTPLQAKPIILELKKDKPLDIKVELFKHFGEIKMVLRWKMLDKNLMQEAVKIAKESDVAIVFAGLSERLESEGGDRSDLLLPGVQEDLIKAIAKVNKNTIVVLNTGAPILMNNWLNQIPALVEVWYPGQEGGNAIADILFGNINPSGKLPMTFLNKWTDSPAYGNYPEKDGVVHYKEGIFVGYRHFDKKNIKPLFPFGHGLSYTNFSYNNLKITPKKVKKDENVKVSFTIKNIGLREGAEVAQLYLKDMKSSVERPVKELKEFKKINLKPNETKLVSLTLKPDDMKFFDVCKKDWVAEAGNFKVIIGSSSRDIRLEGEFDLK